MLEGKDYTPMTIKGLRRLLRRLPGGATTNVVDLTLRQDQDNVRTVKIDVTEEHKNLDKN